MAAPLLLTYPGGSRVFEMFQIPEQTTTIAIEGIPREAFTTGLGLRGDRLERPAAFTVHLWLAGKSLKESYVLAYDTLNATKVATQIIAHGAIVKVQGILWYAMVPDGQAVRLTLEFAPTGPAAYRPITPEDLPSTALWLDASDEASINDTSGLVGQWSDKGPSAYHATPEDPDDRPTTGVRTIGGLNAVEFYGDEVLTLLSGSGATTLTRDVGRLVVLSVAQSDTLDSTVSGGSGEFVRHTFSAGVGNSASYRAWCGINGNANKMQMLARASDDLGEPGTSLDGVKDHDMLPRLFGYDFGFEAGQLRLMLDGVLDSVIPTNFTPQRTADTNSLKIAIGARSDLATGWWKGSIGEIAVLEDPKDWEVQLLSMGLLIKWGLGS